MRKPIAVAVSVLLFGISVGQALAGTTLDDVRKKGLLVAGVKSASPPFGFVNSGTGELAGYDVDFVKAVAARLGVKAVFIPVTASNRIPELLDGSIDIIAATMTRTPGRSVLVDFSDAYFVASQKVLAEKGAVTNLADLRGKKIGTARGSAWEFNLRAKVPGAAILPFDNSARAVEALRKGEIDAVSTDARILAALLPRLPPGRFEIVRTAVDEEPYVMAVRKGDKELLGALNETIREMAGSGEARKINDRWFEPGTATVAPPGAAGGIVLRRSADPTRFVVMPIKGVFKPGAEVSFFDPAGSFVARGSVKSFYTDEVYVDIDPAKVDSVDYGFVVVMNVPDDAAKDLILKKQDLLRSVTQQIRSENIARWEKIGAKEEEMAKQRRQEQLDFERRKMELDYMYDNYWYGWHPWW